jgi:hypothetical protein
MHGSSFRFGFVFPGVSRNLDVWFLSGGFFLALGQPKTGAKAISPCSRQPVKWL